MRRKCYDKNIKLIDHLFCLFKNTFLKKLKDLYKIGEQDFILFSVYTNINMSNY